MPPQIALTLCTALILWLFIRDRKLRPLTSWPLLIVLIWFVIIGSRPVSFWFSAGIHIQTPDDYLEGSPFDRILFLFLIVLGLFVLLRRKTDCVRIIGSNRWVLVFFLYCGVSVIWSDYPFVGFKRWIKDIGNVIMVLILLTEKDPVQAVGALLSRYTYFAIPLSVTLIKYFPNIGRYYNRWTWEPFYSGVTTEKNGLGCIALVCGLYIVSDLIESFQKSGKRDLSDVFMRALLLVMILWLMTVVNSSTAIACFVLGAGILFFMKFPMVNRQIKYLGTWSIVTLLLALLLYMVPDIRQLFVSVLQREMTLTGRTDLWTDLLSEQINPLIGVGYQSFWLGPVAQQYWEKYSFHPNQAHNGYLELYLNGGIIAVFLLVAMMVSAGRRLKADLLAGKSFAIFCFSFLVVALVYNWTEAMFSKMTIVWFVLIMIALYRGDIIEAGVGNSEPKRQG